MIPGSADGFYFILFFCRTSGYIRVSHFSVHVDFFFSSVVAA